MIEPHNKRHIYHAATAFVLMVFIYTTYNYALAVDYTPRWEQVRVCQSPGCETTFVGTLVPNEGSSVPIYVEGTYTDQNGCLDVASSTDALSIFLKRGSTTCAVGSDFSDQSCYTGFSSTTPACSTTCGLESATGTISCAFNVWWNADATDVGAYSSQDWSATLHAKDQASIESTSSTLGFEMATLNALDFATSTYSFGTLAVAATSSEVVMYVVNRGNNNALDIALQSTDMTCDKVGEISATQIKMATSAGRFYDSKYFTMNNAMQELTNFNLLKTSATSSGSSSSTLYFEMVVPYGVGGACGGTMSVVAQ